MGASFPSSRSIWRRRFRPASPSGIASIVIQDACVLINLLASGRLPDIAGGCGLRFAIASVVASEAIRLRGDESGEWETIDLQPLVEQRILEVLTLGTEVEKLRYIELALVLDDGEAKSIAIAVARSFALATDDRKARTIIHREGLRIELWSTCGLLRHWQSQCSIPDKEMAQVLSNISRRAKYRPKPGHPDFNWWRKLLPE